MDSPDAPDTAAPPWAAVDSPAGREDGAAATTSSPAPEQVPARTAARALLFAGTALLLATLVQPAAVNAGRWAARNALRGAHRSLHAALQIDADALDRDGDAIDDDALDLDGTAVDAMVDGEQDAAGDGLEEAAPSRPCTLPDWHPQVECSEQPGRSFFGLALPPGHPPIDAAPALPPGHPPIDGFESVTPDGEVRPIPVPLVPAVSPLNRAPEWI